MRKNKRNKGFTLVELVIAVAILGIVISPLIANFIQSAKLNRKSKISLNATNMAQDIMEGASAYSAEEFIKMFQTGSNLKGKLLPDVIEKYTSHGECDSAWNADDTYFTYDAENDAVSGNLKYVKSGTTDTDLNRKDYYFVVKNVKQANNTYDLRFHINTETEINKNAKEVASIAKINAAYDAICTISKTEENSVAEEFRSKSTNTGKDASNFAEVMERTTTIAISDNGGTQTDYTVSVKRTYTIPQSQMWDLGLTDSTRQIEKVDVNISNTDKDQLPRSVYLYFEGMGNTSMPRVAKRDGKDVNLKQTDHFVINNNTGKAITVYLIRNQKESERSEAKTVEYNNYYGADVDIHSTDYAGAAENQLTEIVSNLRYHLSTPAEENVRVTQENSVTPIDGVVAPANNYYNAERCSYKYNNNLMNEEMYKACIHDGYQAEKKNYIYNVTLDLMDCSKDADNPVHVATFTGSLAD